MLAGRPARGSGARVSAPVSVDFTTNHPGNTQILRHRERHVRPVVLDGSFASQHRLLGRAQQVAQFGEVNLVQKT